MKYHIYLLPTNDNYLVLQPLIKPLSKRAYNLDFFKHRIPYLVSE
jgi:hypothetical protein